MNNNFKTKGELLNEQNCNYRVKEPLHMGEIFVYQIFALIMKAVKILQNVLNLRGDLIGHVQETELY